MTSSITQAPEGRTEALLHEMRELADDDPRREELRAEIVRIHTPAARHIARRYAHRGEPLEDIEQSAMVGLVKAINRFDPGLADRFLTYASPMMIGEVKRHFRDRTWTLHVPRRIQELRLSLRQASQEFAHEHGRSATVAELAGILDVTEGEVVEVIGAADAYRPSSLDAPVAENAEPLAELVGNEDTGLANVVDTVSLRPLLADLPDRERRIVLLRFFGNQTQSQIAEEIGISQMHVSRLISRSLDQMRTALLADA